MQITVTGAEYPGQVTSAWLEGLEPRVCIDIQKEGIIRNDVIVYTKRTFPVGINELIQLIIKRSKPPNL
ncbi:hypothetical protein [Neobacillus drentensis]|uniref:hypothetical protein n=1 Tax=Neobacillus drentensis TaxID=220684 RepID=UPI002857D810|nr:hypothetical protein [Neobacillus drentensis]MDR7238530.1 UDP-glucose 6-dehydrogenase [Neobacillus drentensis]